MDEKVTQAGSGMMPGAVSPSDEDILRERAKKYAATVEPAAELGVSIDVLCFTLGEQTFGVKTEYVVAANPLDTITPLPGTPPSLVGLTNFKSRVLPVYNLLSILDFRETGITDVHYLLIVSCKDTEIGFITDKIGAIQRINLLDLQAMPGEPGEAQTKLVKGISPDQLVVINMPGLISSPAIIVNDSDL